METTKLSTKGQVIIPKAMRHAHHWEAGLELMVIDTGDGLLLKPMTPFPETALPDVAGSLRSRVRPKTDAAIKVALKKDFRRKWGPRVK